MQIVNLSEHATILLAEAATRAIAEGKRFRVSFHCGEDARYSIAYKVGEGMWSAPLYDQPDPYRD